MADLLTTTEAAHWAGMDRRNFARWARRHQVEPQHRVRLGRSFVTLWSARDLVQVAARSLDDEAKLRKH